MSTKFNILFKGKEYKYRYSYNENTTFSDILESFSFNYPNLNICPCYKIQHFDRINSYKDVDMNSKVKEYLSRIFYDQFQIVLKSDNKYCNCNSLLKEYYKKPKIEIINKLYEYKDKIQRLQNYFKEKEKLNKETNFIDFYDIIININSIKDICKGWEIKMNENTRKNYKEYKSSKSLKIGVIGNANKGKSFLLSKIANTNLPSGTSIRTEGLSVKYLEFDKNKEEYKNRKIVLLDSAGLETPVLKEKSNDDKMEKNELNENEPDKKENDLFKEKSREKLITELFLQNYIINYSDILFIVVGILTYSEQKLLNRIKTEFIKLRKKNKMNKPLYVIHNLMTYKTVKQVEEYITDRLLKSATFDLEKRDKISTRKNIKNGIHYIEKNTEQEIFHLIFAHEGSEAGKFYNQNTLNFIENLYQQVINLDSYDVIETVKDKFIEISNDIFERSDIPITKENFDNSNNSFIKLSNVNNVILKKCLIDELGFSNLKANGFEPTYNYYKSNDGKKLIIRLEIPGNSSLKATKFNQYNLIKLEGCKNKDTMTETEEKSQISCREYGKFTVNIPWSQEDYVLKNTEPVIKEINGIICVEYQLEEKQTEVIFNPKPKI